MSWIDGAVGDEKIVNHADATVVKYFEVIPLCLFGEFEDPPAPQKASVRTAGLHA